jgi:hypothetical protein
VSVSPQQPPLEAVPAPSDLNQVSPYQPCDACGTPLDHRQRYCVACGTRRKHADDPAARFLSSAARRRRAAASAAPPASRQRRAATSAATAVAVAVIPLALGAGVLIGRSASGGDAKLIAALHAEKAPVIEYSGTGAGAGTAGTAGTAATVASATTAAPVSTFKLTHGFAVQLGTLPAGTGQAAAAQAEHADVTKGAGPVGLIAQSDFRVTPSPPSGAFVIYAGSYASQAAARSALAKLKARFPAAKVIAVRAVHASPGTGGKALTRTRYGTAHQVTNYKPNAAALSQGSQVASQDSRSTGKAASGSGLPDVVAVP